MSALCVEFAPHWINGWFVGRARPAARRVSVRSVRLTVAPDTAVVMRVGNGLLNSDPCIPSVVAGPV
ncbi:hypothetical protein FK530_12595 [Tsukamurella conjunctivitidis]|uniref:Uncharacterized protein n=1 Tax=Tsukamurella conjunctivitidis TaxID=2592068 RepID=A0A5C5RZA1_9ACTN|nr:hypothetical protein [Tsukamurella conjunctivitidis]TWS28457.1 hypothetical protein FK530_12595 [Tsukamurella conjunctivitidis]